MVQDADTTLSSGSGPPCTISTTLAQHEDTEFGTYRDDKHELNDRQLRSFSIEHALIQGRPKMAHSVLLS